MGFGVPVVLSRLFLITSQNYDPGIDAFPMPTIRPFQIRIPQTTLERLRTRVAEYPWHEMPDDGGWGVWR